MPTLVEQVTEQAEPLKEPIPGDSPQGTDISYEPDFEAVRNEIDKLATMTGEVPEWSTVISNGEQLLKERTKDMRLLMWVAVAHMKKDGFAGLAAGLALIKAVCSEHWEGMYPGLKRARARGSLAGWLGDMILADFAEYQPTAKDKEPIEAVEQLYGEVDDLLAEKLGDKYQGMGAIRTLLREKSRMLPAEQKKATPPPAASSPGRDESAGSQDTNQSQSTTPAVEAAPAASSSGAVAPPATPTMTGMADVLPALRTLGKSILEAARQVRLADPLSPWSYRLNRVGAWLAVKQLPPAEGGKTKIPPPQQTDIRKLQSLFEGQQWSELASTAEGLVGRFLFWLDLHRYCAVALDQQGARDAKEVVAQEVLAFVRLHPGLTDLSFADGTPFADEATKTWLEEEQAKVGGGEASGGAAAARVDEEEQELRSRFEEAREMVLGGKIAEGLGLAAQLARRGSDERSRFRAQLETALLALKGGKPELAKPFLEGLAQRVDTYDLERWEPELCARLYAALLKARGTTDAGSPSNEELFERLCRIDPAAAMKATGN